MIQIVNYHFGSFTVEKRVYNHDIKIINEQVKFWKDHSLDLIDMRDLIEAKPEIIVIGTGTHGTVKVSQEIIDKVKENKIKLVILKTEEACKKFNALEKRERKVAAIMHATC